MQQIPTTNTIIPHNAGNFHTITDALDYAATGQTGLTFYGSKGEIIHTLTYSKLREQAIQTANRLLAHGLQRGDVVAIIADTSPQFLTLFYGCQYAGLIACPLPYTVYLGGKAAFIERIKTLTLTARAKILCLPENLSELSQELNPSNEINIITLSQLNKIEPSNKLAPLQPDEIAYMQFSSGSTSDPKGIMISQNAICNNARGILQECIKIKPYDRAFSWLPFYHDMGLVGFSIAPLFAQTSVDYIAPTTFARRPLLWLQLMSDNQSTITFSPVFGYRLSALRFKQSDMELDLSSLRLAGIGGDMIHTDQLNSFAETMQNTGFRKESFTPSYGMAEASLLVTYHHGLKTDKIDKTLLEKSNIARPASNESRATATLTICGKPLNGHTIKICDINYNTLPERHIGHILIKGPSLMTGYCNATFTTTTVNGQTGYLDTGDIGYIFDNELVVTGRHKDMITINGRNIWPQDIEIAVTAIPELNTANIAVFSINNDQGEEVVVLVESRNTDQAKNEQLKTKIRAIANATSGVHPVVAIMPPKSLPFTSSGKLARAKARQIYLNSI